jgi:hypothetical protein
LASVRLLESCLLRAVRVCYRLKPGLHTELVSEGEFVAEDIEAGDAIFAFLIVALALATFFAVNKFAFAGNRAGELDAEVKVAANAFPIRAIETENGFGVFEIRFVFHATVSGNAFSVEVLEIDGE